MAKDVERLVLELSADVAKLERGMRQGQRIAEQRTRAIERSFDQMNKNTGRSVDQMSGAFGRLGVAFASAFGVREIARLADGYTRFTNQLKVAGLEGVALTGIQDQLFTTAQRYGVQLESLGSLYGRLSQSSRELGASEQDLLQFTNAVAAAIKVQGGTAESARGALTQLSQALGGQIVRAEEFNSINEGARPILQAVANGIDRFGGSVSALRQEVIKGQVTSQEFFQGFLRGSVQLEAQAGQAVLTIAGAMQVLNNALGKYIGNADANLSATQRFAEGIAMLSRNLDDVALVAGAVATIMGVRFVLAMTAGSGAMLANALAAARLAAFQTAMTASLTGTTTATVVATGAMARFNAMLLANPIGAVILVVAALTTGLVLLGNAMEHTGEASRDVKVANDALAAATDAYTEAANAAAIATGKEAAAARQAAAEKRALAIATRDSAQAKLVDAAATVAQIQAEAGRALQREMNTPLRAGSEGSTSIISQADRRRLADAQASAAASRASITAAQAAIAAADAAIRRRAPASPGGGGGGGGRAGGGSRVAAISREAQDLDDLRKEISSLSDDLMSDTEKAAADLAKVRDTLRRAVAAGLLTVEQAARMEGGAAAQGMSLPAATNLNPLDDNARFIADELEGGREALRREREAIQQEFDEQGRNMARDFIDIVRSEDIGAAIGARFREAAFEGLEAVLSQIFSQAMGGNAQGGGAGNWVTAVASLFGGGRALGGPVKAGKAYRVNENTPNSEFFVPKSDGWVGNIKQPRGGQRSTQNVTVRNELYLAGANGDSVIYANVRRMLDMSQRQTVAAIKAGAPSAQLEQQLLRE